jgi:hypothetical protein
VAEVFETRLREAFPLRAERVLSHIREMRGGRLNDPRFGSRQHGEGRYVEAVHQTFEAACRRLGYADVPEPRGGTFRRPPRGGQLGLFD